jgi:hypothetical protein
VKGWWTFWGHMPKLSIKKFFRVPIGIFVEIVKCFVQGQVFLNSWSLKRGPIGSETSVRNYHYSLCSNPEKRSYDGNTVLWNTRSYRPYNTVSHPRILEFLVSPLWEPNFSYFVGIFIFLVCLMTLFIAKTNTELECGRKCLWLSFTWLKGLRIDR